MNENVYYKVLKDGKVIDVLDKLIFSKWNHKHSRFFIAEEKIAEVILSSDGKYHWHIDSLKKVPVDGYDTVTIEKIDKYEYNRLKSSISYDIEKILDEYTMLLMERGVL